MHKSARRRIKLGVFEIFALLYPLALSIPPQAAGAAEVTARDAKSLQAAIDAQAKTGGRVTLAAGTFEIDRTLLLDSDITLEGVGPSTIIKASNKFDVATDVIANRNKEGNSHISIRNLQVVGDWARSSSPPLGFTGASAIRMTNATDVTIRDVIVRDTPGSGVRLSEFCQQVVIDSITSENNAQGVGVHGRSQDVTINNSLIRRNSNGIYLWSEGGIINNLRITNNRILEHLFDDGIKVFGAIHYQIIGNLIDGAQEGGIEIHNIVGEGETSGHFVISGNIIRNVNDGYNGGSNGVGIYFGGATTENAKPITDFVISNNIVENTMFGFVSEMDGAGRGVFQGNYVSKSAKGGMHILRTRNFNVNGNVFADNGNYESVEGYETFGVMVTNVTDSAFTNNIIIDTRKDSKFKQEYGLLFRHDTRNVTVADNVIADVQKPMGFLYGSDAFLSKNMVVTNGVGAYQERGRPVPFEKLMRTTREGNLNEVRNLSAQLREEHAGADGLRAVDFYEALALNASGKTDEARRRFPDVNWGNFQWQGGMATLAPRGERQEIRARRLTGIKLDGQLDDAAWKKADWHGHYVGFRKNTEVAEKTAVAVGYDDENLFVAMSGLTNPKTLQATEVANVDNVWGDDNFEFFIAPQGEGIDYYQFIVNPLGAFYDSFRDKGAWQSGAKVAVGIGSDCWNLEIAIPLKNLAPTQKRQGWRINFNRKDNSYKAEQEQVLSSWSFVNGAIAETPRFGHLTFE